MAAVRKISVDEYIDGGLFDNWPIRKAFELSDAFVPGGVKNTVFGYLDVNASSYPQVKDDDELENSIFTRSSDLLGYMFSQARQSELYGFLLENSDLGKISLAQKSFSSSASELMEGFIGFLESDFRRFDFIMGMFDAIQLAQKTEKNLKRPEKVYQASIWKMMNCFDKFTETGVEEASCRQLGEEKIAANIHALYRVSIKRLYQNCLISDQESEHPICIRARRNDKLIDGMNPWTAADLRKPEESEFNYFIRLLIQEGYRFSDVKIK